DKGELYLDEERISIFSSMILSGRPIFSKGTTHMSIIDREGNAASMTISNGEGSGYYVPKTGIMLNNMLGEDDLHPHGFHTLKPGIRVSSMMSPTFIKKGDELFCVIGSGGSKRIKTALLQVIVNMLELSMPLHSAIESPRIHLDDNRILQIEPGIDDIVIETLKRYYKINCWKEKNMYFGGVNAVTSTGDGWADSRRGGAFLIL
ncbi:MAG: gamma-glutamyltransferase, partial [Nitrospirae bacterium]